MSTYLYELPTTGAISFADFCSDQSGNKSYGSFISESTQVRANLRAVLKESKRTDDNEKDYLRVVKASKLRPSFPESPSPNRPNRSE